MICCFFDRKTKEMITRFCQKNIDYVNKKSYKYELPALFMHKYLKVCTTDMS